MYIHMHAIMCMYTEINIMKQNILLAMYSDNFYSVLCNFNFKAIRDNLVF